MYCWLFVLAWLVIFPQWLGGGSGTLAINGGLSSPKQWIEMSDSSLPMNAVVHQIEIVVKRHLGQCFRLLDSDLPVGFPEFVLDDLFTDLEDQTNLFRCYQKTYFRQHRYPLL